MRWKLALLVAATFCGGAASYAQPVIEAVPERARIIITGYGEVKSMPDVATITYTARGEGATSDEAVRAMASSQTRIGAAVRMIDAAIEPQTDEVKIAAVRSNECKEQTYGPPQLSAGACAIAGYVATQSAKLRTGAVKDAGTIVGLVGRAGGLQPRIESFQLRDSRPAQQQAIAAALGDAASKANAIASASHVRLGPIFNVTSGPRNDVQQIVISGSRIPPQGLPLIPPPPPPILVKVTPESVTTNSYITVTYAIGQ